MQTLLVVSLIVVLSWACSVLIDKYDFEPDSNRSSTKAGKSPSNTLDNIWWFVQISDLHLSEHRDPTRADDLRRFCTDVIGAVKPSIVFATGDLTDAKRRNFFSSAQSESEWKMYADILRETKATERVKWIDMRGNHDGFDVPNLSHRVNYFRKYSIDKGEGGRVFRYDHQTSFGQYSFIVLDSVPDPGLRRPFNFFGVISEEMTSELSRLTRESAKANMTFLVGHYPMSVVNMADPSIVKSVLKNCTAHLCGHFHNMKGKVNTMHILHKTGHLELELADWKENRKFRIVAIDHDLLSFGDFTFGEWPLVVVTNPKDAHYIPAREPWQRMAHSTHIRILAFSLDPIRSVHVSIDDGLVSARADHADGPLYTLLWSPMQFEPGLHKIVVRVTDASGRVSVKTQTFSLDGTRAYFHDVIAAFLLLTDFCLLGRILFAVSVILVLVPLMVARLAPHCILPSRKGTLYNYFIGPFASQYIAVASRSWLYYPILLHGLNVVIGPWYVGEFLTGHWGVQFAYGIYVRGRFIVGSLTYVYGALHLLLINLPLTLCIAQIVLARKTIRGFWSRLMVVKRGLMLTWIVALLLLSTYEVGIAYGWTAVLISPVKGWAFFMILYLVLASSRVSKE